MREYEKHQSQNGQPPNHQFAKELMAGIAGAEASFIRAKYILLPAMSVHCIVLLLVRIVSCKERVLILPREAASLVQCPGKHIECKAVVSCPVLSDTFCQQDLVP